MQYDNHASKVDLNRLIRAPLKKCLVPPNAAGSYPSAKNERDMVAPDWRHRVFGRAAERDRSVLAYDELPFIGEAYVGRVRLLCPLDFLLVRADGSRLIAFDIPGLRSHEMSVLLGLAAIGSSLPIIHVTDAELRAFERTRRFPPQLSLRAV